MHAVLTANRTELPILVKRVPELAALADAFDAKLKLHAPSCHRRLPSSPVRSTSCSHCSGFDSRSLQRDYAELRDDVFGERLASFATKADLANADLDICIAQWRSSEDFEALLKRTQEQLGKSAAIERSRDGDSAIARRDDDPRTLLTFSNSDGTTTVSLIELRQRG